jgi:hypothetical protein
LAVARSRAIAVALKAAADRAVVPMPFKKALRE